MKSVPSVLWLALALFALAPAAPAATIVATGGTLESADDLGIVTFDLPALSVFWIQSYGFGGGTASNNTLVPSGGFDPWIWLFSGTPAGSSALIAENDDGFCPPGNATDGCVDSSIGIDGSGGFTLPAQPAGSYFVVVSTWPSAFNGEIGDPFSNGFVGGATAGFNERTGNYFIDVQSVDAPSIVIPEPASLTLAGAGLLALALLRCRR